MVSAICCGSSVQDRHWISDCKSLAFHCLRYFNHLNFRIFVFTIRFHTCTIWRLAITWQHSLTFRNWRRQTFFVMFFPSLPNWKLKMNSNALVSTTNVIYFKSSSTSGCVFLHLSKYMLRFNLFTMAFFSSLDKFNKATIDSPITINNIVYVC